MTFCFAGDKAFVAGDKEDVLNHSSISDPNSALVSVGFRDLAKTGILGLLVDGSSGTTCGIVGFFKTGASES